MNSEVTKPSIATSPDLDWSQVRETVRMLNLAVAQIDKAMHEGDDSINTLAESFTTMIGHVQTINAAAEDISEGGAKTAIDNNCSEVLKLMQAAIMAFQFYDKLSQRLSHVSNSLGSLGELIEIPDRLFSPYEWKGLQQKIKSKYTIAADKAMFDAILDGATVDEALKLGEQQAEQDDDIELF